MHFLQRTPINDYVKQDVDQCRNTRTTASNRQVSKAFSVSRQLSIQDYYKTKWKDGISQTLTTVAEDSGGNL